MKPAYRVRSAKTFNMNWAGFATTKGRQVYSSVLGDNFIPRHAINHRGGFLIGWDRWSDGRVDLAPGLFSLDHP